MTLKIPFPLAGGADAPSAPSGSSVGLKIALPFLPGAAPDGSQDARVLRAAAAAAAGVSVADSLAAVAAARDDLVAAAAAKLNAAHLTAALLPAVEALDAPGDAPAASDEVAAAAAAIGADVPASATAAAALGAPGGRLDPNAVQASVRSWVVTTTIGTDMLDEAAQAANRVRQLGAVPTAQSRIDRLEEVAANHGQRMDLQDQRLDDHDQRLDDHDQQLGDHATRIGHLEGRGTASPKGKS